jgi:hypothetical protein
MLLRSVRIVADFSIIVNASQIYVYNIWGRYYVFFESSCLDNFGHSGNLFRSSVCLYIVQSDSATLNFLIKLV